MRGRRPDYCERGCEFFVVYKRCLIAGFINKGWVSDVGKQGERARVARMSAQDMEKYCAGKQPQDGIQLLLRAYKRENKK